MPLVTAISAGGVAVRSAADSSSRLILQNVGTVPIAIYFNSDGTGDPVAVLAGGTANDDGLGSTLTSDRFASPVWAKAPAGGGRLLVSD